MSGGRRGQFTLALIGVVVASSLGLCIQQAAAVAPADAKPAKAIDAPKEVKAPDQSTGENAGYPKAARTDPR